jgi:hypothetical protein
VLFGRPGWHPNRQPARYPREHPDGQPREHPDGQPPGVSSKSRAQVEQVVVGIGVNIYVLIQYLVLLGAATYFLFRFEQSSLIERVGLAVWIFATAATLGMLLEQHKSSRLCESVRVILTICTLFFWMNTH